MHVYTRRFSQETIRWIYFCCRLSTKFTGLGKYYDKKLEFLRVDKITETKLICRKMTKAKDKWVSQGGSLDRVSLVLTLDDFAKTCCTNYRSFYNPEDPALIRSRPKLRLLPTKFQLFIL